MAVLERELCGYYREIDVVNTPNGAPVAMVHVNNFTSEMNAWANLFEEVIELGGGKISRSALFEGLYQKSLECESDTDKIIGYNFLSGEPIVGVNNGMLLFARTPDSRLTLASFMKMQIYSALGSLAIGCEILSKENVRINNVYGHGGFFKTPFVGQSAMSAAIGAPVTVMKNASEGGAFGIALLALFTYLGGGSLGDFLNSVFADADKTTVSASDAEVKAFSAFMEKYKVGLAVQKFAGEVL